MRYHSLMEDIYERGTFSAKNGIKKARGPIGPQDEASV